MANYKKIESKYDKLINYVGQFDIWESKYTKTNARQILIVKTTQGNDTLYGMLIPLLIRDILGDQDVQTEYMMTDASYYTAEIVTGILAAEVVDNSNQLKAIHDVSNFYRPMDYDRITEESCEDSETRISISDTGNRPELTMIARTAGAGSTSYTHMMIPVEKEPRITPMVGLIGSAEYKKLFDSETTKNFLRELATINNPDSEKFDKKFHTMLDYIRDIGKRNAGTEITRQAYKLSVGIQALRELKYPSFHPLHGTSTRVE